MHASNIRTNAINLELACCFVLWNSYNLIILQFLKCTQMFHDDVIKWKHFPRNWSFCGEFTGPGEFPTQRPVTRSFDVFFDLRLNKRLSKRPCGSCDLRRHRGHYDVIVMLKVVNKQGNLVVLQYTPILCFWSVSYPFYLYPLLLLPRIFRCILWIWWVAIFIVFSILLSKLLRSIPSNKDHRITWIH